MGRRDLTILYIATGSKKYDALFLINCRIHITDIPYQMKNKES
jgi:hypothetical protein